MKNLFFSTALILVSILPLHAPAVSAQQGPEIIEARRMNTSPRLRDLNLPGPVPTQEPYVVPNRFGTYTSEPDLVEPAGKGVQSEQGMDDVTDLLLNFEGATNADNVEVLGFQVVPPDTEGDVGPNHYVQWINLVAEIFDKNGNTLMGPFPGNFFFTGMGGVCEETNSGDPIVLYDHLADRWMVSQFAIDSETSTFSECVAVSQTSDPTGAYHQYEFPFGSTLPDYPKLGVWKDAYYMTARAFESSVQGFTFTGMLAVALERKQMLAGNTARMIVFDVPGGTANDGWLPADLDGPPPPSGTPGFFAGAPRTDDPNEFEIFQMDVDWTAPSSSTFSQIAELAVDPFDRFICGTEFRQSCIPQPPPSVHLDALTFALMHRLQFRDFGSHQTLLANHTVDASGTTRGPGRGGIRWYELRNKGTGWAIHQQGTYAPDDGEHRWMGSIAMNGDGDIALGYSVSSRSTFPSIRVAGQTADRSGTGLLNVTETNVQIGGGSQFGAVRWGDYSMMAVDPSDDQTFWYTQEYYASTARLDFKTRIASFTFEPTLSSRLAEHGAAVSARSSNGDPPVDLARSAKISLQPNFPDPFTSTTTIRYTLPSAEWVKLTVHDILGRQVASLVDGWKEAGTHQVVFRAADRASGVHLYRFRAGDFTQTRRMLLTK